MIGLGAGTLATYGAKGDVYRFYDINPAGDRHRAARLHLSRATATRRSRLPLGDARLSLEREPPQNFDVLAIDAFSSDAIPVHLITSEALGDLQAAHEAGRRHRVPRDQPLSRSGSGRRRRWRDAQGLSRDPTSRDDGEGRAREHAATGCCCPTIRRRSQSPSSRNYATPIEPRPDWRLWTDDFNNLVQVLK